MYGVNVPTNLFLIDRAPPEMLRDGDNLALVVAREEYMLSALEPNER